MNLELEYVVPTSQAGELESIAFIKSLPEEDREDIEKLATSPESQSYQEAMRPLYGLAQAGRKWHNSIATYLMIEKLGFVRCCRDSCLFIWKSPKGFILCAMHVDDFVVVGSAAALKDKLVDSMKTTYKCTDLGALNKPLLYLDFASTAVVAPVSDVARR